MDDESNESNTPEPIRRGLHISWWWAVLAALLAFVLYDSWPLFAKPLRERTFREVATPGTYWMEAARELGADAFVAVVDSSSGTPVPEFFVDGGRSSILGGIVAQCMDALLPARSAARLKSPFVMRTYSFDVDTSGIITRMH